MSDKQVALGESMAVQGVNETTAVSREIASIQGAIVMAKQFPRNEMEARKNILASCQRPGLAMGALYKYARGGSDIEGASIRLAEEIARAWGNIEFGVRELEQLEGESVVESYAWDLQTNTRQTKRFTVPHERHSKYGVKKLTDPRDIYETIANNGARRLRNCILGVIPQDIVDEAVEACKRTQAKFADVTPENVEKMLAAFAKFGVTLAMIEDRIQRSIDAIDPYLFNDLRRVYQSLDDNMGGIDDYFDTAVVDKAPAKALGGKKPAKKAEPKEEKKKVDSTPPDESPLFEEGF